MKNIFLIIYLFLSLSLFGEYKKKFYSYFAYPSISTIGSFPIPPPMGKYSTPQSLEKITRNFVKKEEISKTTPIALAISAIDITNFSTAFTYIIPLKDKKIINFESRFPNNIKFKKDKETFLINNVLGIRQLEDYVLFGQDIEGIKNFEKSSLKYFFNNDASFTFRSDLADLTSDDKKFVGLGLSLFEQVLIKAYVKDKEIELKIDSSLDLKSDTKLSILSPKGSSNLMIKLSGNKILKLLTQYDPRFGEEKFSVYKDLISNNYLVSILQNGFYVAIHNKNSINIDELKKSLPPMINIVKKEDFLILTLSPVDKGSLPNLGLGKNESDFIKGELHTAAFSSLGFSKEISKMLFDIKFEKNTKGTVRLILK